MPALTRSIRIDYTALSLTIPERVRFRYRLEGWETEWHDVGQRRAAFYTDLRPGTYSFRVLASNNDGVWNETGAALAFTVLPARDQTSWFRALVVASLAGALALLYRLHVRRVTAELAARFDERLAERTRLARELHDTLVQTVQGSRMVARHAVAHAGRSGRDAPRSRAALRMAGPGGAGGAGGPQRAARVRPGRATISPMRSAAWRRVPTGWTFRRSRSRRAAPHARCTLSCKTTSAPSATKQYAMPARMPARRGWTSRSRYGRDFVLLVTDNGVGMDQAVLDAGKPEHFGLAGMRERAANIHASLSMTSSAAGTSLRLVVPGRLAFRER